jgi:4-hydroxybutyrate dehydrogenase / sulfolactaldehyde 3-reductase
MWNTMPSSQHAVEGKLLIMVGGTEADLKRSRPVLEQLGDTIVHCGPVGTGARMKIVNNFMSVTLNATTAEALTLAEASGLDPELVRKVMLGTVAGQGHMATTYPAKVLKKDLTPGFMIELADKDLALAIELAGQLGVEVATGAAAKPAYEIAGGRIWPQKTGPRFTPSSAIDGAVNPLTRSGRRKSWQCPASATFSSELRTFALN